ncbi:MAG: amidase, partial [Oceanospirillaceae bacterium]
MHTLSAVQTVEKLNTRELSAHQVLDFLNKRIDLLDPKLNAFLYRCTAEVSDNKASTILAGLPISFKDQYHIEGLPCSFGMPKAKSSAYTANLVQVLLDNGANILGKTSLPPFAMDFQTSNEMRGFCNNPWNRLYTCGGSSGGGAAAIASGMSLIDFGTDLAGSLRIPASFCGVYSLLPSEGRLSNEGIFVDESQNIDHFARTGPITRTIEDLDFIWRVLMDTRPLEENAVNTRDLKIAFWQQAENLPVDQDIITAMNDTLDQWRANGHNCRLTKPTELSFSECWQVFGEMMGYEVAGLMNPVIRWFIILTSGKSIKNSPNFIKNVIQGYRRNNKSYQK